MRTLKVEKIMSVKRDQKMGSGGNCISPKCGYKALHNRSVPARKHNALIVVQNC
jgi:hypothetical protein